MPVSPPRIAVYDRSSLLPLTEDAIGDRDYEIAELVGFLGGTVVATFTDMDTSSSNRLCLSQMLEEIRGGHIDIVVCHSLDRLARDAEDIACLAKAFDRYGIELHTISEGHLEGTDLAIPFDPYRGR
jgi:DNA invertase Pin-like site-specific DNA recombinase